MTDFLEQKRKEIRGRMDELKPAVEEYARLQAAASALADGAENNGGQDRVSSGRRRGPGRPRGPRGGKTTAAKPAARKGATSARGGRTKGTGSRTAQALAAVQARPGITVPELATEMGIKKDYLYHVLSGLEREKKVRKEGRGWHPVAAAT